MGKTAVVVDDSTLMRKVIGRSLKKAGFEIAGEGGTGQEAMVLYRVISPDIVTLDLSMPDSKELEWLEEMLEEYPDARIVVITSMGDQFLKKRALEMGASGFLTKPVEEDVLIALANEVVEEES